MAQGQSRKISAASARSHTRKHKNSTFSLPKGTFKKLSVVLLVGLVALCYQAIKPPPANIISSPTEASISSIIKLKDGRNLAYIENGVPKKNAKHKIIFVHGFDSCKHDTFHFSKDLMNELEVYVLSFDRPGYCESDPNPEQSEKSIANDIEELADSLKIGTKFYVIGYSFGAELTWAALKHIPHRLEGAAVVSPISNYWWPSYPSNISNEAFSQLLVQDQRAFQVSHYLPWLTYWWNTQKWFPGSSLLEQHSDILCTPEKELCAKLSSRDHQFQIRQQGDFESVHRDLIVGFGTWGFDPLELEDPFLNTKGSVHLWHGTKDAAAPILLSQYISEKLPWVRFHKVKDAGHMFPFADGQSDTILKVLLLGA